MRFKVKEGRNPRKNPIHARDGEKGKQINEEEKCKCE